MTTTRKLILAILVLLFCTAFDQITKDVARERLASAATISLLRDTIRIQYSENPGATLGLGANLPPKVRLLLFVFLNGLISLATLLIALKSAELRLMQLVGLLLVASGGLGNLLDRLFNNGAAIDFLNLGIGPVRTGIFNVADVFIVGGALMFLVASLRERAKPAAA